MELQHVRVMDLSWPDLECLFCYKKLHESIV
jgi:hypothetical protein